MVGNPNLSPKVATDTPGREVFRTPKGPRRVGNLISEVIAAEERRRRLAALAIDRFDAQAGVITTANLASLPLDLDDASREPDHGGYVDPPDEFEGATHAS